jgi:hypothetical protein
MMYLKYLLAPVFVICFLTKGWSQSEKRCNILEAFLKSNETIKRFQFDKDNELPIIIVDTAQLFKNCQIETIAGRKVKIAIESSYLLRNDPNIIIVYSLKKRFRNYIVEIHNKYTGSYGRVYLRKFKKHFEVVKFLVGYV